MKKLLFLVVWLLFTWSCFASDGNKNPDGSHRSPWDTGGGKDPADAKAKARDAKREKDEVSKKDQETKDAKKSFASVGADEIFADVSKLRDLYLKSQQTSLSVTERDKATTDISTLATQMTEKTYDLFGPVTNVVRAENMGDVRDMINYTLPDKTYRVAIGRRSVSGVKTKTLAEEIKASQVKFVIFTNDAKVENLKPTQDTLKGKYKLAYTTEQLTRYAWTSSTYHEVDLTFVQTDFVRSETQQWPVKKENPK